MKRLNTIFLVLTVVVACLMFGSAVAQEEMSMDEYKAQLAEWQAREAAADSLGKECTEQVAALKDEITNTQGEIDKTWEEIYAEIGVDAEAVDAYRAMLKDLEAQAEGILAMSPEDIFKKRKEIEALEAKVAEAKANRISALSEMQDMLAAIDGKIAQIKNKMPKAMYDNYTVVVGDYLWKISGKEDIYDDATQWMRIYSYNKDQIKDADLIFPEQMLKIHRGQGPDEYIVAKGDYLKKIAENPDVLGDAANWTKLYEANKDVIGEDSNTIYPHTVLVIPRD